MRVENGESEKMVGEGKKTQQKKSEKFKEKKGLEIRRNISVETRIRHQVGFITAKDDQVKE